MNGKEFAEMIKDGLRPVVTFSKDINDQEGYLEPGMRGRIVGVRDTDSEVLDFIVELAEFDDFNKPLETANYYDDKGVACLTARQAGQYKPTDTVYADADRDFCWKVESSERLKLYQQFNLYRKDGESYVRWLEDAMLLNMKSNYDQGSSPSM